MSLTDENRTIAKLGIAQMKQTQRIGLVTLIEKLSVKVDKLDEKTIGFQIGPRLNALGRLGDATPGVQLLTTFDDEEAQNIVDFMQSENEKTSINRKSNRRRSHSDHSRTDEPTNPCVSSTRLA